MQARYARAAQYARVWHSGSARVTISEAKMRTLRYRAMMRVCPSYYAMMTLLAVEVEKQREYIAQRAKCVDKPLRACAAQARRRQVKWHSNRVASGCQRY